MTVAERLAGLRGLMEKEGLAGYVIPSMDPHQSEYVARTWQRRGFISGFDGSAGTVAVTGSAAGLWTDSRYFLQAGLQLQGSGITLYKEGVVGTPAMETWLAGELGAGDRVGVDPWVFSWAGYEALERNLAAGGLKLVPVASDLVEQVWGAERPAMPDAPVRTHDLRFAGESVQDKLARISRSLEEVGADAMIMAALDEIAWTFNLRGGDVDFNPVFVAYALVLRGSAVLFMDPAKLGPEVGAALPAQVKIRPYEEVLEAMAEIGSQGLRVQVDASWINQRLVSQLTASGAGIVRRGSPIFAWKASKNQAELEGMRAAHQRDGVAMVRFLTWLETAVGRGNLTELSIEERLEEIRKKGDGYVGCSFRSIIGYKGHGAIVHYSATPESNSPVTAEGILLVDSGGQYSDGTTDITRTLALGEPTDEQKRAYTAVLKGHLRLGRTCFPRGTDGYQLDILARAALWDEGLNYAHGTGHGVGAHLCVHEGPFSVSLRKNLTPLQVGNVLSNEPGFYKEGEFGIRIENLEQVVEKPEVGDGTFLGFEVLTLCPYDLRLIELSMLTAREKEQVNRYHELVRESLTPFLDDTASAWLARATRAIQV